jgi:hypothetical protein
MLLAGLGITVLGIILTRSEALYPVTLFVRAFFLAGFAAFYWLDSRSALSRAFPIVGFGFVLTSASFLLDRSEAR